MKNFECRLTHNDPGLQCGPEFGFDQVSYYKLPIHKRGYSNWYDFSDERSIECDLERIYLPDDEDGYQDILDLTSWDVTVKVVSPKQMVDTEAMAEEFELAMRSFECTLLGNCGLFNENGHPLNYIFGDRYDFTKGFEATLAAAVTLSAAHTANIEAVNVNKGMAGQVIEITGTGFENDLEPTDKNWTLYAYSFSLSHRLMFRFRSSFSKTLGRATARQPRRRSWSGWCRRWMRSRQVSDWGEGGRKP